MLMVDLNLEPVNRIQSLQSKRTTTMYVQNRWMKDKAGFSLVCRFGRVYGRCVGVGKEVMRCWHLVNRNSLGHIGHDRRPKGTAMSINLGAELLSDRSDV